MRPVNLIPPEERRARAARTGLLPYLVVGALVALLGAVTLLVVTGNEISDRKAEIARLEQERDALQTNVDELRPFAEFASMQELRTATVTSLAQSRFDWERVMRELALVLPDDAWLVALEGTVSPDVEVGDGVEVSTRSTVPGPALELIGCTVSQEAVGRLVAALKDIDGVTRVGVNSSERAGAGGSAGAAGEGGEDCRTRDFITQFGIVVAFDAVPAPEVATPPPLPDGSEPGGEQVAAPEQAAAQESVQQGIQEGQQTADLAGGT
jgi:Tfp pilus assembly protein PilN